MPWVRAAEKTTNAYEGGDHNTRRYTWHFSRNETAPFSASCRGHVQMSDEHRADPPDGERICLHCINVVARAKR